MQKQANIPLINRSFDSVLHLKTFITVMSAKLRFSAGFAALSIVSKFEDREI